jgi:hypothetical protein
MPGPKHEWSGDRLLVGCIVVLSLGYGGWLLALRLRPANPEANARQSVHGFVTGSSQPSFGGGEASPAEAGEYRTSRWGTSHVAGGGSPRPIAEGARAVLSEEPTPNAAAAPSKSVSNPAQTQASQHPRERETPALGRLELGPRVGAWLTRRYTSRYAQVKDDPGGPAQPGSGPRPDVAGPR